MIKYTFIFITLLLISCNGKKKETDIPKKEDIVYEGNIFNSLYLGRLMEAPVYFGPALNIETCKAFRFAKINMYLKGGRLPNNISEKHTYLFNHNGLPQEYHHFLQSEKQQPYSNLLFQYNSADQLTKIDIIKYMSFTNLPPVVFISDSSKTIGITSKGGGKSDTLIFYPSIENPNLIVEIINNLVNTYEIIANKDSQPKEWLQILSQLDSAYNNFELTAKTITFTENNHPIESFNLDNQLNKLDKSRTWAYNNSGQPTNYKEWLHGSLIKHIEINYAKNNLPSEIIVDRKKFIFHSTFL